MASNDSTATDAAPEGVDVAGVTAWFEANVPSARPPLRFDLIEGGRSNLTYAVTDSAGSRWVLRRPPLGKVLATAHDMAREHRIMTALAPTDVPVPTTLGLCTDESVSGAPFYVMDFVDGIVIRDERGVVGMGDDLRVAISESIVDNLLAIHAVDLPAVGLDDLGRHEGYIERQLKRWYGQFQKTQLREIPEIDRVHDHLVANVPHQQATTIVHGDYRLDNCILDAEGRVIAVLDWEICTLGDPMADLGLLLVYWVRSGSGEPALGWSTDATGFLDRSQMVERYAAGSRLDLSDIDFYVAFGSWKLACILEGVYARYRSGAMGSDLVDVADLFDEMVHGLGRQAARLVGA